MIQLTCNTAPSTILITYLYCLRSSNGYHWSCLTIIMAFSYLLIYICWYIHVIFLHLKPSFTHKQYWWWKMKCKSTATTHWFYQPPVDLSTYYPLTGGYTGHSHSTVWHTPILESYLVQFHKIRSVDQVFQNIYQTTA